MSLRAGAATIPGAVAGAGREGGRAQVPHDVAKDAARQRFRRIARGVAAHDGFTLAGSERQVFQHDGRRAEIPAISDAKRSRRMRPAP